MEAGVQELEKRCKHIFISGLSISGTLTRYMAAKYPGRFKAIAAINGCVEFQNPDLAALAFDHSAPRPIKNEAAHQAAALFVFRALPLSAKAGWRARFFAFFPLGRHTRRAARK